VREAVANVVRETNYQAGEIVAQGVQTFDLYVTSAAHVTIGDNSPRAWDGRLVGMARTDDGLVRMRLSLVAGDRLKVKTGAQP
jgi:hypothetical protein